LFGIESNTEVTIRFEISNTRTALVVLMSCLIQAFGLVLLFRLENCDVCPWKSFCAALYLSSSDLVVS